MKGLFSIHHKDKLPLYLIISIFVLANLIWAFYSHNTWDDDCPGRYQNTLKAFEDPAQFVSLWNRPLFVIIFALPVQLGAWTIPVLQTFFSILAGLSLYQLARFYKLKFPYLAFGLLVFQPFVFGVSKYAMTEPLAITAICISLYLQTKQKWALFALIGGLLPLARLELVILFPFYVLPLLNHKKWKEVFYLGIPVFLWALAAGIIHDNFLWLYENTFGKEAEENRYGHQNWDTYLSRYAYVVGPVVLFFSLLGVPRILKNKKLFTYILAPFLLGFFIYTWFSWKGNMGNAAGFLRNIIPISPHIAIMTLLGISTWYSFASKTKVSIKNLNLKSKKASNDLIKKAKQYNLMIGNGKFYGLIALGTMAFITYIYYNKELVMHHKLKPDSSDYKLFIGTLFLFIFSASILFIKSRISKILFPTVLFITLTSYTLYTEHPMANSSPERTLISDVATLYNNTYLHERPTYVNHPWFFWSGKINQNDSNIKPVKKDSLAKASIGSIVFFENHYSHRLMGDVQYNYLNNSPEWVELSQRFSSDNKKRLSIFEKVKDMSSHESAQLNYISKTDSLDPTSFYCLGSTYLYKLKDKEKAYNAFAKAVNIDSTYAAGFFGLGLVMMQKGNLKSSVEFFNQALKADSKSPYTYNTLLNKGISLLNQKQFNAAEKTFIKAAEKNPKDHRPHFYLGLTYQNTNKADPAIKSYQNALKINPKFYQSWENIAIIQFKTQKKKIACQSINNAVKLGSKKAIQLAKQICN